jgi:hypothetical protein
MAHALCPKASSFISVLNIQFLLQGSYQHLKRYFGGNQKIHKIAHHILFLRIFRSSAVIMASFIRQLSESSERNIIVTFFHDIL